MIGYASGRKINVMLNTTLSRFDEHIGNSLITSGLDTLLISLDGASQESVERYQKGNNFTQIIDNIKEMVGIRESLKSGSPKIYWLFLVNRHNESEIKKAKKLAGALKIDGLIVGKFRCDMAKEILFDNKTQYENVKSWLPEDEELSMYNYRGKRKKNIKNFCKIPWTESVINPNGSVSPCCAVWEEKFDFGNINDYSFREIWNSEKYITARRINKNNNMVTKGHICYICKQNKAAI